MRRSGSRAERLHPAGPFSRGQALGARAGSERSSLVPASPSEPRLRARGLGQEPATRTGWRGACPRGKPRPPERAHWSLAAPGLRPVLAPPFFRAWSPPRAASGPRSLAGRLAGSLGRALRDRPPVWSARARRRPDDAAARERGGSRSAFPGSPERDRQPARVQPRSAGEESGPGDGDAVAGRRAGLAAGGAGGTRRGPGASGREVGTRPPPRREKAERPRDARRARVLDGEATPPRARATSPTASGLGDSGRRAGRPAGERASERAASRGEPACTGWTRRAGRVLGSVWGAPHPGRPHLDPAGHRRPGRSGPLAATTLAAPSTLAASTWTNTCF